jgi:streptogramin lyase
VTLGRKTRFAAIAALTAVSLICGCSLGPKQVAAQSPPIPPLQYVGAWGVKGTDPGQLDQPTSIATDVRGNVYIADAGSQFIDKFQPTGTPLLSFQDERLKHPQSIAVDRGGAIYVTDPVRASVFIFLPDGSRYREIRLQTRPNAENTLDVAVCDDGSMSILDVNASKVFGFSPSLRLAHIWKPGTEASSGSGRPESVAAGPVDTVFVSGISANSLLRYDDGKLTSQIALGNSPQGDPSSVSAAARIGDQFAVSSNYIFASDADGRKLHVWTLDGKPKADIDLSPELGPNQRFAPPIAVSPMNDLLILDSQQARVLHYHINL